jgi:folate-binding protein YgfZ
MFPENRADVSGGSGPYTAGMPEPAADWTDLLARLGAEAMPYGPPGDDGTSLEIVEAFDRFEAEYAAIRRRVGVMALPQRGVLQLTGADVKDYLHRLCTQQINELEGGRSVRAFQLDEKGQIAADLIVHHGDPGSGGSTWLESDGFDLPWVAELLEQRLFTEDVTVQDWRDRRMFLWLLGPAAVQLLTAVAAPGKDQEAAGRVGSMPGTHHVLTVAGVQNVTAYRWDVGSVLGVRLAVPTDDAPAVFRGLLEAAGYEVDDAEREPDAAFAERRRASLRGRPVGWSAFNTVRIEEGVPWPHVDFGRDSLPAEVPGPHGIDAAVSFSKGCYLGQEVVARMKSLGHPKKLLVGLTVDDDSAELPVAGSQVVEAGEKEKVIGGVTSSTLSPLRGQAPIALAVVRWGRHRPGTKVRVPAGGKLIDATVTAMDTLTQVS